MSCEGCPLGGQRQVFGEGSKSIGQKESTVEQYDVVCVGMAPAKDELRLNRPFVGLSGQVLRGTLHQLGIHNYYLTNTLLCSITTETDSEIKKAVKCCYPRLLEEIQERNPKLTIALGDLPLKTLSDTKYSIKEIEGRVIHSEVGMLLPVSHPAYYLRRPEDAMDFVECMRAGVRILEDRYQQAGDVNSVVVTEDSKDRVLESLSKYEYLAVDTETTGFDAYGMNPNRVLEMGISPSSDLAYIVPHDLIASFKELLETKKLLMWSAKFDCSFLRQHGISPNIYFDGMLAHYCLDERSHSHGLKKVARTYLGSEDWEEGIKQYLPNKNTTYDSIPTAVRYEYLSKDVARTYQLWEVLEGEVESSRAFWDLLMPATKMFSEIEHRGIRIDGNKLLESYEWLREEVDKLEQELFELAGESFNPRSPKQVGEILYGRLGVPMDPGYGPTTNKQVLEAYREEYEAVDKLLTLRERYKDRDTYLAGFAKRLDRNFRVHPTFKLHGQVAGRIASENPAMMNVKSGSRVKEIFVAEPGRLLAEFDFKGMELRWYCIYSKDEVLIDMLLKGADPHSEICKVVYGDTEESHSKRLFVKTLVFGRLYGRSRASFSRLGTDEEVDHLLEAIDSKFPGLRGYSERLRKQVHTKGYVESYFGRRRRFPIITDATKARVERQAGNMPTQSAGSDLNLSCMLHLWDRKEELDIYPLFPVHDSILIDIPNKEAVPILKKIIEEKALEVVNGALPFPVDADWGVNWSMDKGGLE